MAEQHLQKVAEKVLQKLNDFVDTVKPGELSPQAMKHVTATLKDIRELTEVPRLSEGTTIRVEFDNKDWND